MENTSKSKNQYTVNKLASDIKKLRLKRSLKIDDLAKITYTPLVNLVKIEKSNFGFLDKVYMRGIIENIFLALGKEGETYWVENKDSIDGLLIQLEKETKGEQNLDIEKDEDESKLDSSTYTSTQFSNKEVGIQKRYGVTFWILLALSILVIIGGVFATLSYFNAKKKQEFHNSLKKIGNTKENKKKEYKLYSSEDSFILKKGDSVKIFLKNKIYELIIEEISENKAEFVINNNNYDIVKDKHLQIVLDEESNAGVEISLKKQDDQEIILFVGINNDELDQKNYEKLWKESTKITVSNEHVLLRATNQRPIVVYIKAEEIPSNIIYNVDGNQTDNFNLRPGSHILIQAEEHLQLQLGNYRSLMLFVNDIPILLDFSINSFSISKIIKWIPNGDNQNLFDLIIKDMIRP